MKAEYNNMIQRYADNMEEQLRVPHQHPEGAPCRGCGRHVSAHSNHSSPNTAPSIPPVDTNSEQNYVQQWLVNPSHPYQLPSEETKANATSVPLVFTTPSVPAISAPETNTTQDRNTVKQTVPIRYTQAPTQQIPIRDGARKVLERGSVCRTHYALLCRLVVEAGNLVLNSVFNKIYPPLSLADNLSKPQVQKSLRRLKSQSILSSRHWELLYPNRKSTVTSDSFSSTLLVILLKSICHLSPPYPNGWKNLPLPGDKGLSADLARISWYRRHVASMVRQLCHSITTHSITTRSITTHSITTHSITTHSITTHSITTHYHYSLYHYSLYHYSLYYYSLYHYSLYHYSLYYYSLYHYSLSLLTLSLLTLSLLTITTHSISTHSITTHSITTHSITTHSITTHSITTHSVTTHSITMTLQDSLPDDQFSTHWNQLCTIFTRLSAPASTSLIKRIQREVLSYDDQSFYIQALTTSQREEENLALLEKKAMPRNHGNR
ncbi:hypothetical protein EB796_004162 [Bugula neritina]|uniref:DZIP3-like HEPN domain-containing protein n=1 Tax=Bugula neritina TaxID=10212 RepID=A0A7J7KJN3_BUGNE|nr:hypothetical protein EB796_004162 [Bugula neritina]